MKHHIARRAKNSVRPRRRSGDWSPFRLALLGGSIVAGVAMWAVAIIYIAERHF